MLRRAHLLLCLASIGCWNDDYAALPSGVLPFRPSIGGPADWNVTALEVPLTCPDEQQAQVFVLAPAQAPDPLPTALLFHSGSFDYVFAPRAGPDAVYLEGAHYAEPSRLTGAWAANQVYTMLGMRPLDTEDDFETHDGSLAVALAEAGIAVVMPANCWGDLWANQNTQQTNDFSSDLFVRDGRTSADWAYRAILDPEFAAALDLSLPFVPKVDETYLIGLGEGGRAVAELLSRDDDDDGTPTFQPIGAAVDCPPDDLRVYYEDAGTYPDVVEGLTRMYFDPAGPDAADPGSMWSAPLPPRVAYLYSSLDTTWPAEVHQAAVQRIDAAGGWAADLVEPHHILLDGGSDPSLPPSLVTYLTTGVIPTR